MTRSETNRLTGSKISAVLFILLLGCNFQAECFQHVRQPVSVSRISQRRDLRSLPGPPNLETLQSTRLRLLPTELDVLNTTATAEIIVGERIESDKTDSHKLVPQEQQAGSVSIDTDDERNRKLLGTLVLLSVPLSWGTYSPVVRYLYEIQPPVPGFVFSACYYALAAATTLTLAQLQTKNDQSDASQQSSSSSVSFRGGLELGSYLFVANCLQVVGLQTVQAERAGFLVQLTTVMVPLAEALFAANLAKVPIRTWAACVLAFGGLIVMGLDDKEVALSSDTLLGAISSFTQGDFLILGAAVLYTLHVVRLGEYARETTPMKLAAAKATTETILSFGLIVAVTSLSNTVTASDNNSLVGFAASTGREITSFFDSFSTVVADGSVPTSALLSASGAILWTGWVTCAYTIWAQSYGQSRVSPTNANLIYTFQPIFTAFFAYALLGETMGAAGFAGGAIIATAVYTVASSGGESTNEI